MPSEIFVVMFPADGVRWWITKRWGSSEWVGWHWLTVRRTFSMQTLCHIVPHWVNG